MVLNPYFTYKSPDGSRENLLYEDLLDEAIQIHGVDTYYVLRTSDMDLNNLYGELHDSVFDKAYNIEMYVKNYDGYDGQKEYMSKFGFEIRSYLTLNMTYRAFKRSGPFSITEWPREGDLIYIPIMKRLFEIRFVDNDKSFHPFGRSEAINPYMFELQCELYKFSHDNFGTGIQEIDVIENESGYILQLELGTGSGNYQIGEFVYCGGSNVATSNAHGKVVDWNPDSKLLNVINIVGDENFFTLSANIIGEISNAIYTLSTFDPLKDFSPDNIFENKVPQDIVDPLIIQTNDPLGNL